jgi:CheY-like chemotaxis protein
MTNFGFGVDSGTAFALAEKTTGHQQTISRPPENPCPDDSAAEACIRNGAYEYLLEPFEREQLLAVVASALEHRRKELA